MGVCTSYLQVQHSFDVLDSFRGNRTTHQSVSISYQLMRLPWCKCPTTVTLRIISGNDIMFEHPPPARSFPHLVHRRLLRTSSIPFVLMKYDSLMWRFYSSKGQKGLLNAIRTRVVVKHEPSISIGAPSSTAGPGIGSSSSNSRTLLNPDSVCSFRRFCSCVNSASGGKQSKPVSHPSMHLDQEDSTCEKGLSLLTVVQKKSIFTWHAVPSGAYAFTYVVYSSVACPKWVHIKFRFKKD